MVGFKGAQQAGQTRRLRPNRRRQTGKPNKCEALVPWLNGGDGPARTSGDEGPSTRRVVRNMIGSKLARRRQDLDNATCPWPGPPRAAWDIHVLAARPPGFWAMGRWRLNIAFSLNRPPLAVVLKDPGSRSVVPSGSHGRPRAWPVLSHTNKLSPSPLAFPRLPHPFPSFALHLQRRSRRKAILE